MTEIAVSLGVSVEIKSTIAADVDQVNTQTIEIEQKQTIAAETEGPVTSLEV